MATFTLTALALVAPPARAQEGAIVLEGGAVRSLPSSEVGDATATYGIAGLRVEWGGPRAALVGGAYGGQTTDEAASDFYSGVLGGDLWLAPGRPVDFGVGVVVQGFQVREPLLHRVTTGELSPMVRFGSGSVQLVARGRFGGGTSLLELRRLDGTVRRAERELWSRGVEAELGWASTRAALAGVVGWHESQSGFFRRGGVRLAASVGAVTVRLDGEVWDTPGGGETVGGVSLSVPIGRVEARASVGRTAPDPLTLVESGTQSGVLIGMRLASFGASAAPAVVHEIVQAGSPAIVMVRVSPPVAASVAVLGDFDEWAPIELARAGAGNEWTVELVLEPGTYHFGFLVDGEWWVPEGLQGTVPDEWGRMNATMVVPDEEEP
jgi:hypothetical protein